MDVLGITYIIENAQQFWSEIDDILHIPSNAGLSQLDATLRRFVWFGATYHEQYLQSPMQLEHACNLILDSELFTFHSDRMKEILMDDGESTTDPHSQYILYNLLLLYGRRNSNFLRSQKKWQPLLPLLMDHVLVDFDPEVEDTYTYTTASVSVSGSGRPLAIPIEARLRYLSFCLLYEVCRVQKLSMTDLKIFDDAFIDYLFDLVEQTRNMHDETLNYSIIKFIVSLNEQFMVAALQPGTPDAKITGNHHHHHQTARAESQNRVLQVLMRRLNSSQTFGENMIFMLNRANRTPEDLCMQLLVLKILYLLFTTKGASEYFYTNDLCVLVDVFLRELVDLDEESESLRHTYLRVLHPLLTKTQLRSVPYKRPQIVRTLESLVANANIRDISPTTQRLVSRCLSGEWCVQFRKPEPHSAPQVNGHGHYKDYRENEAEIREGSPSNESVAAAVRSAISSERPRMKTIKTSKSAENLKGSATSTSPRKAHMRPLETLLRPNNESSLSLASIAGAAPSSPTAISKRRDRASTADFDAHAHSSTQSHTDTQNGDVIGGPASRTVTISLGAAANSIIAPQPVHASSVLLPGVGSASTPAPVRMTSSTSPTHRRPAPPTPPKRRKAPAIPVTSSRTNGGGMITTIASSTSSPSPLSMVTHA